MITAVAYRYRRYAAWLGVFAVLFQAWLPLAHHPATLFAPDGEETVAFDQFSGQALMPCAAAGVAQEKGPPSQHRPARHIPVCPICQALHMIGGLTPPSTVGFLIVSVVFVVYPIRRHAPGYSARIELPGRPRAPPLSA
jgi:hypothetical protein